MKSILRAIKGKKKKILKKNAPSAKKGDEGQIEGPKPLYPSR